MKIIPHKIFDPGVPKSETRVFDILKRAYSEDKHFYVLHSLGITDPKSHKKWLEADFVLVRDNEVIVVEVKGGQVHQTDGRWATINRNGVKSILPESPVKQAHTCAQAIKRYLKKHLKNNSIVIGHCVIFPDIQIINEDISQVFGPEVSPDICLCGISSVLHFKNFVEHVFHFYRSNFTNSTTEPITAEQIVNALRPSTKLRPFASTISLNDEYETTSLPAMLVLANAILNLSAETQNLRSIVNRGLITALALASSINNETKVCLPIRFKSLINENPYFNIDNVYYFIYKNEELTLVNGDNSIIDNTQNTFTHASFLILLDSVIEVKLSDHINQAVLDQLSPNNLTTIHNELFSSRTNIPIVCQLPYLNADFLTVAKTLNKKITASVPCIMKGKLSVHRTTKNQLTETFKNVLNRGDAHERHPNQLSVVFSGEEEFRLVSGLHTLTTKIFSSYQDEVGVRLEIFSRSPVRYTGKVILIIGYSKTPFENSVHILSQVLLRTEHQLDVIIDPCLDDYRADLMMGN